jgi:tRNA1Val (adenine37-N6)-methyltransferase
MKKTLTDISMLIKEGETVDEILGGILRIFQKKKGYRFSIDALLLAHFVRLKKGDHIVELGTGSGIIAIIMSQRRECGKIIGVDIQAELVEMANRSLDINALSGRVDIRWGDVRRIEQGFNPQSFDVVIFNPPYRKLKSGRINPNNEKSVARHEIEGTMYDFLKASGYVLKKSGRVYIIYHATRIVELLSSMRIEGMEPKKMRIVHSHKDSRGEFVLVEGIKGGREELEVLPALLKYAADGKYTEEMTCIFREISGFPKASDE